jgi:hypothetical protein
VRAREEWEGFTTIRPFGARPGDTIDSSRFEADRNVPLHPSGFEPCEPPSFPITLTPARPSAPISSAQPWDHYFSLDFLEAAHSSSGPKGGGRRKRPSEVRPARLPREAPGRTFRPFSTRRACTARSLSRSPPRLRPPTSARFRPCSREPAIPTRATSSPSKRVIYCDPRVFFRWNLRGAFGLRVVQP